ncbi:MAG: KH domain-containing protein [Dehalococcoidia bacterium]|nr:KH domain-containing protein [Dehalococcoidia bacterium]
MDKIEISAKTAEEAIELALRELDAKRDEVETEVITKGKAGILGIGAEPARVKVSRLNASSTPKAAERAERPAERTERSVERPERTERPERSERPLDKRPPQAERPRFPEKPPEDPDRQPVSVAGVAETELSKKAKEILTTILSAIGVTAKVTLQDIQPDEKDEARMNVSFNIEGDDSGLLIGRRGETLSSLQFLVNFLYNHNNKDAHATIILDVEGYRERRYASLRGMANRMADRVASSGASMVMPPMPPSERRIVHMTLANHTYVFTESTGEGKDRMVQILPRPGAPPPPRQDRRYENRDGRRPPSRSSGGIRPAPRPGYSKGVRSMGGFSRDRRPGF